MLILMNRSQATKIGRLQARKVYEIEDKKIADRLLEKKFGEKISKKAAAERGLEPEIYAEASTERLDRRAAAEPEATGSTDELIILADIGTKAVALFQKVSELSLAHELGETTDEGFDVKGHEKIVAALEDETEKLQAELQNSYEDYMEEFTALAVQDEDDESNDLFGGLDGKTAAKDDGKTAKSKK